MSDKVYTRAQKNWFNGVYKIIVLRRKGDLEFAAPETKLFLQWRVGLNLYNSCQFFEAFEVLEKVTQNGEEGLKIKETADKKDENYEDPLHKNSDVHLCAARCCFQLFLQTKSHYHLEISYQHYKNAIDTMTVDLSTMFRLPKVLLELGRVFEHYGAFEAALDIYTRVMTNFPNFRGYFDAMYRSCVVGRHLAEIMTTPAHKAEIMGNCIDMLQFLLEALPSTINDVRIFILPYTYNIYIL